MNIKLLFYVVFPSIIILLAADMSAAKQRATVKQDSLVLPIGSGRGDGMATYHLCSGILEKGGTGGGTWNPLAGGVTTLVLPQYNQLESFETEFGKVERSVHPIQVGIGYHNTDYPPQSLYRQQPVSGGQA